MIGMKSVTVSRITVMALILLLVFGSSGVAFASIAPAQDDDTTERVVSCSIPAIDIDHLGPKATATADQFESVIDHPSTTLADQLSRDGTTVPPLWTVLLRYSRHDDSDPLENEVRSRVYDVIEQSPGTYISEVSEQVSATRSTVRYHVRILEEEGLIVGDADGGKHRFYPVGSDDPALEAAMNDNATARVLDSISRLEPAAVSVLADDLDRAPGTVSYHLDRLAEDGLIKQERAGNSVVTSLADGIRIDATPAETELTPTNAD
ncbi:winged helix-turn-helix transcriptional regulator [Halocatena pleomorpha]|nr:helix-turn-helix domain-containing protein [Halocatena pleomorpha]